MSAGGETVLVSVLMMAAGSTVFLCIEIYVNDCMSASAGHALLGLAA